MPSVACASGPRPAQSFRSRRWRPRSARRSRDRRAGCGSCVRPSRPACLCSQPWLGPRAMAWRVRPARRAAPGGVRILLVEQDRGQPSSHVPFGVAGEHAQEHMDGDCFDLDSTSVKVPPDGTGARKTNGPQSIGKSRGGWHAKIHMVSASDWEAMIFRLSGGNAHDAPEGRALLESWAGPVANAPLAMDRLGRRRDPPPCRGDGDDAGRAAGSEPESRTGLRSENLQASERDRTAVPEVQGLPAPLHAVRQARRDVSGLPEPRGRRRNDV